jgi:arsenate reductase (thioredoxin)
VTADAISVLFVCTGNAARSQMAEALLRREGGDRFHVASAGIEPRGVHPLTVRVLEALSPGTGTGLRSKSVVELLGQSFDYVITVCDRARETCPVFPGGGERLHWSFEDPAEATGTEEERLAVFERVLVEIAGRVRTFAQAASRDGEPVRAG